MERKKKKKTSDRQTQGGCSFVSPIRNEGTLKRKKRKKKRKKKKEKKKITRKRAWGKNKIVLCPRKFQNASFVYSPLTMVNYFRGKVFVAYFETIEAR